MSRHPHRHHRSSRHANVPGWILFTVAVLAGLVFFVGVCLLTPTGRMLLFGLGALLMLFAVSVISCLTGQVSAGLVNFLRLQFGRANLEANFRRTQRERWAGR